MHKQAAACRLSFLILYGVHCTVEELKVVKFKVIASKVDHAMHSFKSAPIHD